MSFTAILSNLTFCPWHPVFPNSSSFNPLFIPVYFSSFLFQSLFSCRCPPASPSPFLFYSAYVPLFFLSVFHFRAWQPGLFSLFSCLYRLISYSTPFFHLYLLYLTFALPTYCFFHLLFPFWLSPSLPTLSINPTSLFPFPVFLIFPLPQSSLCLSFAFIVSAFCFRATLSWILSPFSLPSLSD